MRRPPATLKPEPLDHYDRAIAEAHVLHPADPEALIELATQGRRLLAEVRFTSTGRGRINGSRPQTTLPRLHLLALANETGAWTADPAPTRAALGIHEPRVADGDLDAAHHHKWAVMDTPPVWRALYPNEFREPSNTRLLIDYAADLADRYDPGVTLPQYVDFLAIHRHSTEPRTMRAQVLIGSAEPDRQGIGTDHAGTLPSPEEWSTVLRDLEGTLDHSEGAITVVSSHVQTSTAIEFDFTTRSHAPEIAAAEIIDRAGQHPTMLYAGAPEIRYIYLRHHGERHGIGITRRARADH